MQKIFDRLNHLLTYKQGWYDGDAGEPVSKETIKAAEKFVRILDFENLHDPCITLEVDGELSFYWNLPEVTLDLTIFEVDGRELYAFYAVVDKDIDREEFTVDETSIYDPLPEKIMQRLRIS